MSLRWTTPTLSLLASVVLIAGCSNIETSFDRSIKIAQYCDDIAEAVPVRKSEMKSTLVNAVAVRLLATCADGGQACLDPKAGHVLPPNPLVSARSLAANLDKRKTELETVKRQALQSNRDAVQALRDKFGIYKNDVDKAQDGLSTALAKLHETLQATQAGLQISLERADACQRRTQCVATLAQEMASLQSPIEERIGQLQQHLQRLLVLANEGQSLAEQTQRYTKQAWAGLDATLDTQQRIVKDTSDDLARDSAALAASSAFLMQRLKIGSKALHGLLAADVREAATDLLAARLYERMASRTLAAIDQALAQVDRTIDQVDEHAYGAATFGSYLFSGSMQAKLDETFKRFVPAQIQKNDTARLAFAAAACRRLVPEDGQEVNNASLFSPFLFATLVRIEADFREKSKKAAPHNANETDNKRFIDLVADVYAADAGRSPGHEAVAPTVLQQVALCAIVEQELLTTQHSDPAGLKERARTACGQAAVAAVMNNDALPDVSNSRLARQALDNVAPTGHLSDMASQPNAENATAWQRAMEAVLAASMPAQQSTHALLCQRITAALAGTRCSLSTSSDAVTLDFDAGFAPGRKDDRALEMRMARLTDVLNDGKQIYVLTVYGYASASAFACGRGKGKAAAPCNTARNLELAQERANWALSSLKQRMPERVAEHSNAIGKFTPLSFDTPSDRRIQIRIAMRD